MSFVSDPLIFSVGPVGSVFFMTEFPITQFFTFGNIFIFLIGLPSEGPLGAGMGVGAGQKQLLWSTAPPFPQVTSNLNSSVSPHGTQKLPQE